MNPKTNRRSFFINYAKPSLVKTGMALLMSLLLAMPPSVMYAAPSGGQVTAGNATVSVSGNTTTVNQLTNKAVIDWQSFGIRQNEAVNFLQPGAAAAILNRVTGNEASQILGALTANGRVFLVNPNGILFGNTASVDVAGLMATTLNIRNEDFMAGNFQFAQDPAAQLAYVVNEGRIVVADNGFAYLVAPGVENSGLIVARGGQVALAAGRQAYVDFSGEGLVKFQVSGKITEKVIGPDGQPMSAGADNSGVIQAAGGQVLLTADTARDIVTSVVNNSGVIEARSLDDLLGAVTLAARDGGDVINTGRVTVSAAGVDGDAGAVTVSGGNIGQFGAVSADAAGTGDAGTIDLQAAGAVALGAASVTTANADRHGAGGTILIVGEDYANIVTGARLEARGGADRGAGGFVETSGHKNFAIGAAPDVSAANGAAGTWLIDPYDIDIVAGNGNTNINNASPFTPTDDSAQLGVDLITNALNSNNVTITTAAAADGTQDGNITLSTALAYAGATARTLTLNADGGILLNADISSSATALSLALNAATGSVTQAAGNSIALNGGSLTISAGDDATLNGVITASSITATAADAITLGDVQTHNEQIYTAANFTGTGLLQTTAAGDSAIISIVTTDAANFTGNGAVDSGGDFFATAAGVFTTTGATGTITAKYGISITAGDNITLASDLTATAGGIALTSSNGNITATAQITAAGALTASATAGAITLGDVQTNNAQTYTAANFTGTGLLKTTAANAHISITTTDNAGGSAGNIRLTDGGAVDSSGGNFTANAAGSFTTDGTANTIAPSGGYISITTGSDITLAGDLTTASSRIELTSSNGNLTANAKITADNGLTATATSGTITVGDVQTTFNAQAQTYTAAAFTGTGLLKLGNGGLNGTKSIVIDTTAGAATGDITLSGNGAVDARFGNFTATASGSFTTESANNTITAGDSTSGDAIYGDSISITTGGAITLAGALTGSNVIILTSSNGSITANAQITSVNDSLTATATAGAITLGDVQTKTAQTYTSANFTGTGLLKTLAAGGDIVFNIANTATLSGAASRIESAGSFTANAITATDDLVIIANDNISLAGDLAATAGDIALTSSTGDITFVNAMSPNGAQIYTAPNGNITYTGTAAGQSVTFTAGGTLTSAALVSGTDISLAAGALNIVNLLQTTNPDAGSITLSATSGDIVVSSTARIDSAGAFTATAVGNFVTDNADNTITAAGLITIAAGAGDITLNATVSGTGGLNLTSGGATTLGGLVTSGSDAVIGSGSTVTIGAGLDAADHDISITATTGRITGSGAVFARNLTLEALGATNAGIGSVTYETDGGGDVKPVIVPLNVTLSGTLNASAQSGRNADNTSTGDIAITSAGDLLLGRVTTNGDRGDNDLATVILSANGAITGAGAGTHLDAWTAQLAAGRDLNLNTNLSILYADAGTGPQKGALTVSNNSAKLTVFNLAAREFGQTAQLHNGGVQALNVGAGAYSDGTVDLILNTSGDLFIAGGVSATRNASLSAGGDIFAIADSTGGGSVTANTINFTAGGAVGQNGNAITTYTGYRLNAASGSNGIYLQEGNRLAVGTVTAGGANNNVGLTAAAGNVWFGFNDSKITATGGTVSLGAGSGNISVHADNNNAVIEAEAAVLSAANYIGTAAKAVATNVSRVSTNVTGSGGGAYVSSQSALLGITATSNGGNVSIGSTDANFNYAAATGALTLTAPVALDFYAVTGDLNLGGVNTGANALTLQARAGAINQNGGTLIAGDATLTAAKNIGTDGGSLATQVNSLTAVSGSGGIYVEQTGALTLSATARGGNSNVKVAQTGGDLTVVGVTAAQGGVTLGAGGDLLAAAAYRGISGTAASLTAGGVIGSAVAPLTTTVGVVGGTAAFTVSAGGDVYIDNGGAGSLLLNAATGDSGDLVFTHANGGVAVGSVNVGATHDLTLTVGGQITDANAGTLNLTAGTLTLKASGVGSTADAIEISTDALTAAVGGGGLFVANNSTGDLALNVTAAGTTEVATNRGLLLGVVEAIGQAVKLIAADGDITDARAGGETKANVRAYALEISGSNLGTDAKPLQLDVSILSSSASGDAFADNLGSLHVTAQSLAGTGTINLTASDLTVFDNSGATTTMTTDASLRMVAKNGNIVFLNTDDTIQATGNGSFYFEALGTVLPNGVTGLVGNIIAGNLVTAGGDITLLAENHIGIGVLNATAAGDVTVIANNGLLLDLNGAAHNITGNLVTLSGRSRTDSELDNDRTAAIATAGDWNVKYQLQEQSRADKQDWTNLYTVQVATDSEAYDTAQVDVTTTKQELDSAESKAQTAYDTFYGLQIAFDAADLAASILEIPAGAAQAIPLVGDGGAALALGIAKAVLAGMSTAADAASRVADDLADDANTLAIKLSTLEESRDRKKDNFEKSTAALALYQQQLTELTDNVAKAEHALAASKQLQQLANQAYDNNNVIGTAANALGVTAEHVDAVARGQSDIFLESPAGLGLGTLSAQGVNTSIEITAKNGDVNVLGQSVSNQDIVIYAPQGAVNGSADGKLVTKDLTVIANSGIGVGAGTPVNTQVDRLAAVTASGGAKFVNDNGLAALTVDEISVSTQNVTQTVSGISAAGDILVQTAADLFLNKAVKDNSNSSAALIAEGGAVTGADSVQRHVITGTLTVSASTGIGTAATPLRTDVAEITAAVTGGGDIEINELDAVQLTAVTAADGRINIVAGGSIEAVLVVSSSDAAGHTVTLTANTGNLTTGTVSAGAVNGDIFLTANSGYVNGLNAANQITGHDLTVSANSGVGATVTLNSTVFSLDAATVSGALNLIETDDLLITSAVTGDGGITITSTAGTLTLLKVAATGAGNTVTLDADQAIVSGSAGYNVITAASLAAIAGTGIGGADNPLYATIDNLEAFTVSGGIYINDQTGDLVIGGVTPGLGKPALSGIEARGGDIVIDTPGNLDLGEPVVTGSGNIQLAAGGTATLDAAVTATVGNITVSATNDIITTANGVITSGSGAIALAAGDNLTTNASVSTTTGNIVFTSGTNISVNEAVTTGSGDITLTASTGNILTNAAGTVNSGSGAIAFSANGDIETNAIVSTTTGDITFTASNGNILTGTAGVIDSGSGAIAFFADSNIETKATVSTTIGNIAFTSGTNISVNEAVNTGSGDITFTASNGNIYTGTAGAVDSGSGTIAFSADRDIEINATVSTTIGDITFTASTGNILTSTAGAVDSGSGAITFFADNDITTNAVVSTTTGNITFTSGTNITNNATVITGSGALDFLAQTGAILVNGTAVTAQGDATLIAATDITINHTVAALDGDVTLTASTGAISGTAGTPPAYHIIGDTLTATAALGIGSDATPLRTNIDTLIASVTGSGDIVITEKDAVTLSSVSAADGHINILAGGSIEAVSVVSSSDAAGNTVALTATSGNITVGTITAGVTNGDIILSATAGQVNNDGDTSTKITGHDLVITASGGIGMAGADNVKSLDTEVFSLSATTVSGAINLTETDDLLITNAVTGNGDITITSAAGTLTLLNVSATGAGNTVTLDANQAIVSGTNVNVITAANLAASAGTGIGSAANPILATINNLEAFTVSGGIYLNDQTGDLTVGGVTPGLGKPALNGVEAQAGDIVINTPGNLTASEQIVTGSGNIQLTAGGTATFDAVVTATVGDITVSATNDIVTTANGAVTSGSGAITLTADGDIETNAIVSTTIGNIVFISGTDIIVNEAVSTGGGTIDFTAEAGDIYTGANGAVDSGSGAITLIADGDIETNAIVSTTIGNIVFTSGTNITNNDMVSTGSGALDFLAQAGAILVNGTAVTAHGDAALIAATDLTINHTVAALDGNVTLTASTGAISGTAGTPPAYHVIGGTLTATAARGIGSDATPLRANIDELIASVTGSGDIVITEKDAVTLSSVSAADGHINILAGGSIEAVSVVSSSDAAGNTVTLTATGGNLTVGTLTAGATNGDLILSATAGQVNNDGDTSTKITGHDLVITASGGIGMAGTDADKSLDTTVFSLSATTVSGDLNLSEADNLLITNAATGDGNLTITSAAGTLTLLNVSASGAGNTVTLDANQSIVSGTNVNVITAANLAASAGTGIGSASNPIYATIDHLEAFTVSGGIYLNDQTGDLVIGGVTPGLGKPALDGVAALAGDIVLTAPDNIIINETVAATGVSANVTLTASTGAITGTSANPPDYHVVAATLTATAAHGLGTDSVPLRTNIETLLATVTGSGGIYLSERDDINLLDLTTADGDLGVSAGGLITTGTLNINGNITLSGSGVMGNGNVINGNGLTIVSDGAIDLDTNVDWVDLTVSGDGDLIIRELDAIELRQAYTNNGFIQVDAGGTISATNVVSNTDLDRNDITLRATGGGAVIIGSVSAGAGVNADVFISATTGGGQVTLAPGGKPVVADNLEVVSVSGINLDSTANSARLVTLGDGDIVLRETDALTLADVSAANGAVTVSAGGTITADRVVALTDAAGNDINLTASVGDIVVDYLAAGAGSGVVTLRADGVIREREPQDADVDLVGYTVNLHAGGDIGVGTTGAIEVDAARLNAYSRDGNITLASPGDLTARELHALNGFVNVSAGGAVNDDGDAGTFIKARDLIISATTGIGNTAPLNTQVQTLDAVTVGGAVNFTQDNTLLVRQAVTGDGDITIVIGSGDLDADTIAAGGMGNTVTLSVPNGIIRNARTDDAVNISGDKLVLTGGHGVGAPDNYLAIATGLITAHGGTGGVYLRNQRAGLVLAGLDTARGDLAIITPGALEITDPLTNSGGGDIYLTTTDTGVDTDYLIVNGVIQARGGNGNIYLNPDDSLIQNATISVEGRGNVTVSAGLDIIMDPVTGITVADLGRIDYTAGRELSLGQLVASVQRPNGGSVLVNAPVLTVNPATVATPIIGDLIRVNTGANSIDLVNNLIAGQDRSSGIWLNDRRVGGLSSHDTTYTWQPRLEYITDDLGWRQLYRTRYELLATTPQAWTSGYFKPHEEDKEVWLFNHTQPRQ